MRNWGDVEAYNEGLRAFFRRQPLELCPYPSSSPRNMVWRDGWEDGLTLSQARLQPPARVEADP